MISVSSSVTIKQSAGKVFEFILDQDNATQWLSGLIESRPTSDLPHGVGHTWIDVVKLFGRQMETEFECTEYVPGQKIGFRSRNGPIPMSGSYTVAPNGGGTLVTAHLEGEPGGFFKLAEPVLARMTQRQWDANLANLRDVLEMVH